MKNNNSNNLHVRIIISMVTLLCIVTLFSACTSYQKTSTTLYDNEVSEKAFPIQIAEIIAHDSSFQELPNDYIYDMISNIAIDKRMLIGLEESEYSMELKIKETKFDKNLDSYFSIWASLNIRDSKQDVVLRVVLVNNSKQSIQSSAYLYKILSALLKALQSEWVKGKWTDIFSF